MAGEEPIGGLVITTDVDSSQVASGLATVEGMTRDSAGRLRDASGKFVASATAGVAAAGAAAATAVGNLNGLANAYSSTAVAANSLAAANLKAIANVGSSSSAWGAVTSQSAANIAKAREAEKAMTVMPVTQLQMSGFRVQDQFRGMEESERKRAELRRQYVSGVRKWEDDDANHPRFRDQAAMGGGRKGWGNFNLAAIGGTLDDLQYVSEMGIRPIINNLMQISPAAGIALLAFDQLRKNGGTLVDVMNSLAKSFNIDFQIPTTGVEGFANAADQARGWSFRDISSSVTTLKMWGSEAVDAWSELAGGNRRARDAKIADFEQAGGMDKAKGKDIKAAVEAFGGKELLKSILSPRLYEKGNEEILATRKAAIIDLVNKAAAGDEQSIAELDKLAKGTGKLDQAIDQALRGEARDKQIKVEAAEFEKQFENRLRAKVEAGETFTADELLAAPDAIRKSYQSGIDTKAGAEATAFKAQHEAALKDKIEAGEALTADELASAPDAIRDKYFREKIKRGDVLSLAERAIAPKAVREEEDAATFKRVDDEKRLQERGSDLQWKLMGLMNPEVQSKIMGADSYIQGMQGQGGLSEEAKRLHEIWEVNKEIARNTEKLNNVGLATRAR